MTEFNTGYPSVRQVQTYTQNQQVIEIKLLTEDVLVGRILWQDPYCLCLLDQQEKQILVWRSAIAYVRPQH